MPHYRAEFDVRTSLVLPEDVVQSSLRCSETDVQIVLKNAPPNAEGHAPHLIASIVGPSDSLEAAADELRSHLARELDILAFVTKAKFEIRQCKLVMEWEPFQKQRRFRAMQRFDPNHPPAPSLIAELIVSAGRISTAMAKDSPLRRAIACFRYGILSDQAEEQFQYFWQAFETVAQFAKERERIPISCPTCKGDLWCPQCGEGPRRFPMAQDAMRALLASLSPDGAEIYQQLAAVRNHVMHGGSKKTVQQKAGIPIEVAVDLMGFTAWRSLYEVLPKLENLTMVEVDSVLARVLTAGPTGVFEHTGQTAHPEDFKIPAMKIELSTRFAPTHSASKPGSTEP